MILTAIEKEPSISVAKMVKELGLSKASLERAIKSQENYYLNILKYEPYSRNCLSLYNTDLQPDSDLFFPWNIVVMYFISVKIKGLAEST